MFDLLSNILFNQVIEIIKSRLKKTQQTIPGLMAIN
jgi:hypothetical protein